ncbi:hypothetical protein AWZ03_001664 [Drosophila navojoa]|uniref:CD80-like immunoglobulin C2-set domain-containing protein n=1 Tax=Drosophila navojoa TaxID=7232 RepID=A0A484BTK8_DRONA|nr:hypothetical protein AWZ03_001664 [Drosophila navojoa]
MLPSQISFLITPPPRPTRTSVNTSITTQHAHGSSSPSELAASDICLWHFNKPFYYLQFYSLTRVLIVTWLKVEKGKFFEFINGRNPPFRNSTIEGAEIDWENSNETQVTLKDVQFDLSGQFYCEVSTDTPIFTKASADELMSVFLPQTGPPTIKFRKRTPFAVGEKLFALCNTTRGRPAPHVTWLINGKKVEEKYIRTHHVHSFNGKHQRRTQQQPTSLTQQQLQHYYQQQYYNQYQPQYHVPHYIDRYDKSLRWGGSRPLDEFSQYAPHHGHDGHGHHGSLGNIHNNPFGMLANYHDIGEIHEIHQRNYDISKKQMELKKQQMELKKHSARERSRKSISQVARVQVNCAVPDLQHLGP